MTLALSLSRVLSPWSWRAWVPWRPPVAGAPPKTAISFPKLRELVDALYLTLDEA